MIVNVGGFGHTGNTALLDFLIDTGHFAPLARDFGETSILRGNWCIAGMLKALSKGQTSVNPGFFSDALLGAIKEEHNAFDPPDINDFKRNARVVSLLGNSYRELVEWLVSQFEESLAGGASREEFLQDVVAPFYERLSALVRSKSSKDEVTYALSRNDPAGYAISLLDAVDYAWHISIIRNPVDVAYEWCNFYHKAVDEPTIRKFANQFCKKIDRFTREYDQLSEPSKRKVAIVSFEDVVSSESARQAICRLLDISPKQSQGKFNPEQSSKNIGVGEALDDQWKAFVTDVCGRKYDKFVERFGPQILKA